MKAHGKMPAVNPEVQQAAEEMLADPEAYFARCREKAYLPVSTAELTWKRQHKRIREDRNFRWALFSWVFLFISSGAGLLISASHNANGAVTFGFGIAFFVVLLIAAGIVFGLVAFVLKRLT